MTTTGRGSLAGYRRMIGAMRDVGGAHARAPDHLARLWATVDREDARRRRRTWLVAAGAVAVAAAAAIAIWLALPGGSGAPRFEVAILDGGGVPTRGDAHLGERLRVRARDGKAIAIRVYRNDRELLLDCPRTCRRTNGAQQGEVTLDAIARYQIVWLDGPAPPATGDLARDIDAASAAGARHELREVEVR